MMKLYMRKLNMIWRISTEKKVSENSKNFFQNFPEFLMFFSPLYWHKIQNNILTIFSPIRRSPHRRRRSQASVPNQLCSKIRSPGSPGSPIAFDTPREI